MTVMGRAWGRLTLPGKIIFTVIPLLTVLGVVGLAAIVILGPIALQFVGDNLPLFRFIVAATAVLLGTRNALYGLRLGSLLGVRGPRRLLAAQLVIDESTAMSLRRDNDRANRLGFWATGISVYVLWNFGTFIGALAAHALPNPRTAGLDAAAPAAFLALLAPRLRARSSVTVAILAAAIAMATVPVLPAGGPVLVAAVVAIVYGTLSRPGSPVPPADEQVAPEAA